MLLAVVAACLAGTLVVGALLSSRIRRASDYLVAGRNGENRGVRMWAWLSNIPSLLGIFAAQMMASGAVLSGSVGMSFQTAVLIVGAVIFLMERDERHVGSSWPSRRL